MTTKAGVMRGAATALLAACGGVAVAAPYDGTYRQAANAECALVGIDGGSIRIADGIFYGVEVECRMTNPVNVVDMDAQLYTMECSGPDQSFSERAMLLNQAEGDGIIMVWDGYAFVYDRCPVPGATPAAAEAGAEGDVLTIATPEEADDVATPEAEAEEGAVIATPEAEEGALITTPKAD